MIQPPSIRRQCSPSAKCVLVLLLLMDADFSFADAMFPDCAANPSPPKVAVTVSGFPNERLYLHPRHPKLCKGDTDCLATAYVVTGDELTAGESCGGWAFVSFKGAKATISGWVPTRRLPDDYYNGFPLPPIHVENDPSDSGQASDPTLSAIPACGEAQTLLNNALRKGDEFAYPALPKAATNAHKSNELPGGRAAGTFGFWEIEVGDVRIHGRPLTVASYESGGTCYEGSVELWTPDQKNRIPIKGSNVDEEAASGEGGANYASEALVRLAGEVYFAHIARSGDIKLYGFHKDLSTYPVCELTLGTRFREGIRTATEPSMCKAVLDHKVLGAPIVDIEPVPLTAEALTAGMKNRDFLPGGTSYQILARGRVDLDNRGKRSDVGIVDFSEESGAGCGHEYAAQWPVLLDSDGLPLPGAALNEQSAKAAGQNDDSRLFTYNGATYMERHSRSNADGAPEHSVWKFTPEGAIQACVFDAASYYATDIAKP